MDETLHHQDNPIHPTFHYPYELDTFTETAPYSETSYGSPQRMPENLSSSIPQQYSGTETRRSESPFTDDLPYCPSACFMCNTSPTSGQGPPRIYDTLDDWRVHFLRDHEGPSGWVTSRCTWGGCKTTVTFTTLKLWLDHVRIVHQKSYYCERPGCKIALGGPDPKPFGTQADLNRHGLTKSHLTPVLCSLPGCPGKENLNRHDKRTKHTLEYHGPVLCTVAGCIRGRQIGNDYFGFATDDDRAVHLRGKHASK